MNLDGEEKGGFQRRRGKTEERWGKRGGESRNWRGKGEGDEEWKGKGR